MKSLSRNHRILILGSLGSLAGLLLFLVLRRSGACACAGGRQRGYGFAQEVRWEALLPPEDGGKEETGPSA